MRIVVFFFMISSAFACNHVQRQPAVDGSDRFPCSVSRCPFSTSSERHGRRKLHLRTELYKPLEMWLRRPALRFQASNDLQTPSVLLRTGILHHTAPHRGPARYRVERT